MHWEQYDPGIVPPVCSHVVEWAWQPRTGAAHSADGPTATMVAGEGTSAGSTSAADAKEGSTGAPGASDPLPARVPLSCSKAFDSLYYCYSPVHQGKVYYQTGQLDDCRGRLRRFRMCAMSRFRPENVSEVCARRMPCALSPEPPRRTRRPQLTRCWPPLASFKQKFYAELANEEAKDAAPPVWELRDSYVERIRSVEEAERREAQAGGDASPSQPEAGWWL
jgi:hypothetical protein